MRVSFEIVPSSTATTGVFRSAMMSMPWWTPWPRGAP